MVLTLLGFNDAVSVASDLTAAQLVIHYWTDWNPWIVPLIFFVFLVTVNAFHVGAYGELGMFTLEIMKSPHPCRVLAVDSENIYHCSVHCRGYGGECRFQSRAQSDWIRQLENSRRPIRWWVSRLCVCLRNGEFCM